MGRFEGVFAVQEPRAYRPGRRLWRTIRGRAAGLARRRRRPDTAHPSAPGRKRRQPRQVPWLYFKAFAAFSAFLGGEFINGGLK